MAYARLLYNLPAERLRDIVRHRAATLRGIPRITDKRSLAAFLAESLSHPHSVQEALDDTDLLQLQVLIYAIVHGGEVDFDRMVAEAGETARPALEQAVQGLEVRGLALWSGKNGTRSVFVPPAVCQQTPLPMPLRYPLSRALGQYDAATVGRIYDNLGLAAGGASTKEARIRAIAADLSDPTRLRERVNALPPHARDLLGFMLQHGGVATLYELASRMDTRQRNQLYSFDWSRRWAQGGPRNAVEELLARGLLVLEGTVGWGYGHILVPGDVLNVLQGRSFFPEGAHGLPAWETVPAGASVRRHESLGRDIAYLLGYLGRAEAQRTGKGTMHRNVLKALAKGLSVPTPEYAGFVYALSRESDLIAPQGRSHFYDITPQGMAWLELQPEAQLHSLCDIWKGQTTWTEAMEDPLTDGPGYINLEDARAYRESVLLLLAELARERPDEAASLDSLTRRAQFRWWSRFPVGIEGMQEGDDQQDPHRNEPNPPGPGRGSREIVRRIAAGSLYWLGLTELYVDAQGQPTHVRLSARGRHRLLGEDAAEGSPVSVVDAFVVQPNLEIYAPPNLSPRLLYRLFRVAEPTGGGMLAISRETLRRALDRGEIARGLLKFLREYAQNGVPQNVEYLINEIGGRHGHIRIGQAGLYLQVDDPMMLKELQAQKKLNIHFRAQLADTVALITGDSVEAVLKQLRQAGYLPVPAEGGQAPAAAPRVRRTYAPPAHVVKATSNEAETRIDWAAVAREDDAPAGEVARPAAQPAMSMDEVRDLVKQAIRDHLCVEMSYLSAPQSTGSERIVEPRDLSGTLLRAYDRTRSANAMFNLRYVRWARLTGEGFEK